MHAYLIQNGELILHTDYPIPPIHADEVLIQVKAIGINRADLLQVEGHYPPPAGASPVPGLEVAGIVTQCGENVQHLKTGDAVCALLSGGGYAEYVNVLASHVLPLPVAFSWEQAAALPEAFCTVWLNLFEKAGLSRTKSILIHAGASGIGSTAIQLAHAFGAQVFVTASTEEKRAFCLQLGAEAAFDYRDAEWVTKLKLCNQNRGMDVILDVLGGSFIQQNLKALNMYGTLINIAFLNGSTAELNLAGLLLKNLTFMGTTLRSRSPEEKTRLLHALHTHVWPLLELGTVAPIIHSLFPFDQAQAAHNLMRSNQHRGKIILAGWQQAS